MLRHSPEGGLVGQGPVVLPLLGEPLLYVTHRLAEIGDEKVFGNGLPTLYPRVARFNACGTAIVGHFLGAFAPDPVK